VLLFGRMVMMRMAVLARDMMPIGLMTGRKDELPSDNKDEEDQDEFPHGVGMNGTDVHS